MALRSNSVVCLAILLAALGTLAEAQNGEIRFENTAYIVDESPMASVEVCVVADSKFLQRVVNVRISTKNGTAMANSDYIPVIDHQLVFAAEFDGGATLENNCILINITDDDIHEPEEHFDVLLIGENSKITDPISNTTVYITDNDDEMSPTTLPTTTTMSTTQTPATQTTEPPTTEATLPPNPTLLPTVELSFLMGVYHAVESDGSVVVCARASSELSESITATITLLDSQEDTATLVEDFAIPADGINLEFANNRDLTQCGTIDITDDEQQELIETFTIALNTLVDTGDDPATTVVATAVVSIIDDDYLECAEDTYIILENTTELTVCVVPVLCVQSPGGSELDNSCAEVTITNEVGTLIDYSDEILVERIDGRSFVECVTITFTSPIQLQPGELDITLSNHGDTEATCRVKVIAPYKVPLLSFEHEQYFVREGMPLDLCGFLVDVTNEFEPPEDLSATLYVFINRNTDANIHAMYTLEKNSIVFLPEDGVTVVEYCGSVDIPRNNRPERARHFSIELSGPELNVPGIQPLSGFSEVFVTDDDGPNVECYMATESVFEPFDFLTAQRYNCLQDTDHDITLDEIGHCYYNRSETDCTHWTPDSYLDNADNLQPFLQNYLPPLCQDLWQTLFEELYSRPPGVESLASCSTQCIVSIAAVNDPKSCPDSVLLMDAVFAPAAFEISGEMILEGCQDIILQITCCDRPLLDECFEPEALPASSPIIIGSAVGGAVVLIVGVLVLVLAVLLCCRRRRGKHSIEKSTASANRMEISMNGLENPNYPMLEPGPEYEEITHRQRGSNVQRNAKWKEVFASMTINPSQLKTQELLGEGAFGQVHKGSLITSQGNVSTSFMQVAIKSLKNSPTEKEVDNFIAESAIMLDFSHPNVMKLVGVCFDTQDGLPLIILPYMTNGDLKTFLRTKRSRNDGGTSTGSVGQFPPDLTDAILIGMCLDIAKGMEYLSRSKFVHRDLAARNCMVDEKLRVCVADFGLSKDVYSSDYYRLTHTAPLPVKWMAPESLYDKVYNEKTDIWSFGVVCWEVFSLGRVPFPGVDNADIPDYISRGHRLRQPSLCPDEMNDLMQSTWKESPEERPTFLQLVHSLANVLGQDISHEYSVLEGPQREAVEAEYDAVTFSTPKGTSTSGLHSLIPEEYEIPVTSRPPTPSKHTAPLPLSSTTHDAPEYANLLSQCSSESSGSSQIPNPTHLHTYHVLEQPLS